MKLYCTLVWAASLLLAIYSEFQVPAAEPSLVIEGQWPGYRRGEAVAVALTGESVLLAAWDAGLQVVDVSQPLAPRHIGAQETEGYALNVAATGNFALVTIGQRDFKTGRLEIYDVRNPARPVMLGNYPTAGWARALAVSGTTAYLCDSTGLLTIDFADPSEPRLLGRMPFSSAARVVAVVDNRAYIGDEAGILQVVDVTAKDAPSVLARLSVGHSVQALAVSGKSLYLALGFAGVQVVELSDTGDLAPRGRIGTSGSASGVAVAGQVAWVTEGGENGAGLLALDISNSGQPELVGKSLSGPANGLVLAGTNAFLAAGDLQVIDVTDPAHPRWRAGEARSGKAHRLLLGGGKVLLADGPGGLQILDAAEPTRPVRVGAWQQTTDVRDVALSGKFAYVTDATAGLSVIDVSDASTPAWVGGYAPGGYMQNVVVVGLRAYVTLAPGGLHILDLTNPVEPRLLGSYDPKGTVQGVVVIDKVVLLADNPVWDQGSATWVGGGLQMVDVSNPAQPRLLGEYRPDAYFYGLTVSGTKALVGAGSAGLEIVDISDLVHPRHLSSVETGGFVQDVVFFGNYAGVPNGVAGLLILDVTDPAAVRRVASSTGFEANAAFSDGKNLYVAAGSDGLVLVNVNDPAIQVAIKLQAMGPEVSVAAGTAGDVRLERSLDLKHWEAWTPPTTGGVVRAMAQPVSNPKAFYRAWISRPSVP